MSVLSDSSIKWAQEVYGLFTPYEERQLQPSSYDLTVELNEPLTLLPNKFYLLSTREWVCVPRNVQGEVHGRSSIGRKGVLVHFTAGFIDPGFEGNITLEVMAFDEPFVVEPGDRVAQICFRWLDKPAEKPYAGRYQHQHGPTPSRFAHGLS